MLEHELELRLTAVARALDADAPAFDPATLRPTRPRRVRRALLGLAVLAALAGMAAAPAAISALRDLFGVEWVSELGSVPPDVAPPYLGRLVPLEAAQETVRFRVRTIPSLGAPDAAYVRDDIVGGMVSVTYGGTRLTQWSVADVHARATVVPVTGTADEVSVGRLRALWIVGTARGIFALVGADGGPHRELFDVAAGALLWQDDGVAFLLQGAGAKANAAELAALVTP